MDISPNQRGAAGRVKPIGQLSDAERRAAVARQWQALAAMWGCTVGQAQAAADLSRHGVRAAEIGTCLRARRPRPALAPSVKRPERPGVMARVRSRMARAGLEVGDLAARIGVQAHALEAALFRGAGISARMPARINVELFEAEAAIVAAEVAL